MMEKYVVIAKTPYRFRNSLTKANLYDIRSEDVKHVKDFWDSLPEKGRLQVGNDMNSYALNGLKALIEEMGFKCAAEKRPNLVAKDGEWEYLYEGILHDHAVYDLESFIHETNMKCHNENPTPAVKKYITDYIQDERNCFLNRVQTT